MKRNLNYNLRGAIMEISWRFPPLSGGSKQGYTNNDIEVFKGEELIDNLAREICQNSLDARNYNVEGPVKVVFELKSISTKDYDLFSGYKKCLGRCREFWSANGNDIDVKLRSFLNEAESTLAKDNVSVLVASDYNTKGLLGNHNINNINTPWEALTGADGISVKSDDNSGGSFGIGKNAPFACSALSMVFYNTYDIDNYKAFVGVGRVATLLNDKGKPTQRIGRYQKNDDEREEWLPIYEEDENSFRDLFVRKEHGTDVIIVGFNEIDNWQDNVAKAVIKNFFVAIYEKRLIVEINDGTQIKCIDDTKIEALIEEYSKKDRHFDITRQLFSTLVNPDKKEPIEIMGEDNAVEIYVKSKSDFARTIANFRSTGMLVGLGSKRMFQHYAAIMIVRGEKLGKLLRECEPPRHNRWDYTLIKGEANKSKRKDAKKALDVLYDKLWRILKAQYETPAGDTTDAPGMSAYLADAEDGTLPEDSVGKDILKAKIKIGKPKVKKPAIISTDVPGREDEGKELSHNGGNKGSNNGQVRLHVPEEEYPGSGPGPLPGSNPGQSPDPVVRQRANSTQRGVVDGNGNRTIPIKELSKRRAFPVQPNLGLYKAVVIPSKDYKQLFVECIVLGEDGDKEALVINKFTYHGKPVNCNGTKVGPIVVEKDIPAEFMIMFEKKEKMGVRLILSEGV